MQNLTSQKKSEHKNASPLRRQRELRKRSEESGIPQFMLRMAEEQRVSVNAFSSEVLRYRHD